MKKRMCIRSLLCFLLILTGCVRSGDLHRQEDNNGHSVEETIFDGDSYTVVESDGNRRIVFSKIFSAQAADSINQSVLERQAEFSSVEDIYDKVLTGTLSAQQQQCLRRYAAEGALDFPNLYDLRTPEGVELDYVNWRGGLMLTFSFHLQDSMWDCHGEANILGSDANIKNEFDEYIFSKRRRQTIISTETVSENNAETTYFNNAAGRYKDITYELETDIATLYICEMYTLYNPIDSLATPSETVPRRIVIFGKSDEVNFSCSILYPKSRPSVEWLSSFGLTPYVEE